MFAMSFWRRVLVEAAVCVMGLGVAFGPAGCDRKGDEGSGARGGAGGRQVQYSGGMERALQVACQSNLHNIGASLMAYAVANREQLPRSLDELRAYLSGGVSKCPKLQKQNIQDGYAYLVDYLVDSAVAGTARNASEAAALKPTARVRLYLGNLPRQAETPIAWDPEPTHGPDWEVNVVFADGSVHPVAPDKLKELLAKVVGELRGSVRLERPAETQPTSSP
jgi:prepilin-type processing-associated H-X9-DG protein